MDICGHDRHCPGFGVEHEAAIRKIFEATREEKDKVAYMESTHNPTSMEFKMSVCAHNKYCPGYGPAHDKATRPPGDPKWKPRYMPQSKPGPIMNQMKDRSLAGKKRRRGRRAK